MRIGTESSMRRMSRANASSVGLCKEDAALASTIEDVNDHPSRSDAYGAWHGLCGGARFRG